MTTHDARIIADSISPDGVRLTTVESNWWRSLLAEVNTHRDKSRNSASTRAIPIEKQLRRVIHDPHIPVSWPCEQSGMQGGAELSATDQALAEGFVLGGHQVMTNMVQQYLDAVAASYPDLDAEGLKSHTLHKSVLGRYLEPWMWQKVILTATEWLNFFAQRATEFSDGAQAEFRATADAILEAMEASTPVEVDWGEWHLPYIQKVDWEWAQARADDGLADGTIMYDGEDVHLIARSLVKQVSVARCARVSYLTQLGDRDPVEDLGLFKRLATARPMHASPFEHVACPATKGEIAEHKVLGNLYGWHQFRHDFQRQVPDAELPPIQGDTWHDVAVQDQLADAYKAPLS